MALVALYIVHIYQYTTPPDPGNGETVDVYARNEVDYDDATKTIEAQPEVQVFTNATPDNYYKPGNEVVDTYTVPTATTAPGYDATAVGKLRTVYHNEPANPGTVRFVDTATCDLRIDTVSSTATTSVGSATGTATVTFSGSAGFVISARINLGPYEVVSGSTHTFTGLSAGADQVIQAGDDSPNNCAVSAEVDVAEFARAGCRDPAASNYDPLATEDGGVCVYTPPLKTAILSFPEAQAIRFILPALGATNDTRRPDNTLLADQTRPGLNQPGYCQKIAQRDEPVIQFRSTFTAHKIGLYHCGTSTLVASFVPQRILQGKGNTAVFSAYLTAHTTTAQARVYFQAAVLPLPILPGDRLAISGTGVPALDGTYPIVEVREDTAQGVPYLVVNVPFGAATALPRLDCTAATTFDVAPFDIWQTKISLAGIAKGCYYLRVTATDPALGAARAVSEPFDLAEEHPSTLLVSYRNFDNAYGLNYSFGLVNKLRVVARLEEVDPATTASILVESNTTTTLLEATARRKVLFRAFQLPAYLHEKLALAFKHDLLLIQGMEYVVEEAYESTPVAGYSLKNGQAALTQRQWLEAGNGDDLGDLTAIGQGFLLANDSNLLY